MVISTDDQTTISINLSRVSTISRLFIILRRHNHHRRHRCGLSHPSNRFLSCSQIRYKERTPSQPRKLSVPERRPRRCNR
ncbi:hypothetical protein F2Q69_00020568 [Brassica cretica]|uniref:Uncharacterized protein n=1 Tax=Brassica cretica TaxID=69181 RepID=A0A8S9QBI0_BRACR|nr:hypothetical protein F2Q69_00020568 [Brassica cretica]